MEVHHDICLEELYLPAENRKDTYACDDFIVYPEGKEKFGGYLIGIVEVRATPAEESEKIIQTLLAALKDNYYEQVGASPDPERLNLETVFEYALQKTNNTLTELMQIGHINIIPENLHYLVAVAKPNQRSREIDFVFAQQGLIHAYLLHKTKQNNLKVINILENAPRLRDEQTDKLKIFSSTLCGKIQYHDTLYLCSEIFNNYIPSHKVNKIISANDLRPSLDYFKTLVNNVRGNSHLTYCAIFIKLEEKREAGDQPVSQRSISRLLATEENTEKFLAPNFALNIRNALVKLVSLFHGHPAKLQGPKNARSLPGILLKRLGALFIVMAKVIGSLPAKFLRREKPVGDVQPKMRNSFALISKTGLTVILVLAIILISSILWIRHAAETRQEATVYAAQVDSVKTLIQDAEVNLVYKNETQSLALIKQANDIIKYLPQATKNQKANYNELLKQADAVESRLLHIEKIVPQLVAEASAGLPAQAGGAPFDIARLESSGGALYVSGSGHAMLAGAVEAKQLAAETLSTSGDLRLSLHDDDALFYTTNQNKLVQYRAGQKEFSSVSIDFAGANLTAARLYNKNIYVLDAVAQQIYRWKAEANGFGARSAWLKDKKDADLSTGADLAIDGNVYIAAGDQIYKFFTGVKQNFTLAPIEPALGRIKKIYTNADLNQLYLLPDNAKRLAVFHKDGSFARQYQFDTIEQAIADFIVIGKTLFFASGNKIYRVDL